MAGLVGDSPPSFQNPLWWDSVYFEALLIRTWHLLRKQEYLNLPDDIDEFVKAVYEEGIWSPDASDGRLDRAADKAFGEQIAARNQANFAIIGFPDEASWKMPPVTSMYDEDTPGVHRDLIAQTRLGTTR